MAEWTHSICEVCWLALNPQREPIRMKDAQSETCCKCGKEHATGIYMRANPEEMLCKGIHE